jgi:hypothetical protein
VQETTPSEGWNDLEKPIEEGDEMRRMNLPILPAVPDTLPETVNLLAERLNGQMMPFPRLSTLLIAYMAWPEDEGNRDGWMVVHLARLLHASGAKLSADAGGAQTLRAFEIFGGLEALADAAGDKLQDRLMRIEGRWLHVADILQFVVDMANETRLQLPGGPSISKAMDLTQRHQSTPTKTVFVTSWSVHRHVAHVLAASAWLSREACKDRSEPGSILAAALLAPEAVIRLAASYQQFGLTLISHGQHRALLDAENLWQVPVPPDVLLPLPARRLSDDDLSFLTTERRARRKDGRPPLVESE